MENVKIYVRLRPLSNAEKNNGVKSVISALEKDRLYLSQPGETASIGYKFQEVFGESATHQDVYESVMAPITRDVCQGYNCAVYAYGSTDSGKSHTMIGSGLSKLLTPATSIRDVSSFGSYNPSSMGLIPRTIEKLYSDLSQSAVDFSIRISYLEIFNEELVDLLATADCTQSLKIYENSKGQVLVNGLTEIVAKTASEALAALIKGQECMRCGANAANSYRSHSIFTLMVYVKEKPRHWDDEELLKFGKLSLIELAGNENLAHQRDKSARFKVNQSLVSFNRIVQALLEKSGHIPYRDSKLTRILQESLGGNSKTSVIATVAAGSNYLEETVNTLEFATRMANVLNKPQINEKLNRKVLLNDISEQINRLKEDIEANRTKTGRFLTDESYADVQNQLNTSRQHIRLKKSEMELLLDDRDRVEELFGDVNSNLLSHNQKLEAMRATISNKQQQAKYLAQHTSDRVNLIERYKLTERILSAQAMEATTAASNASSDVKSLHDSLDRRSTIDAEMESACLKFKDDMQRQIDHMSKYTHVNAEIIKNMLLAYKESSEKIHQMLATSFQHLKSNMELTSVVAETHKNELATKIDEGACTIFDELKNVPASPVASLSAPVPYEAFIQLLEKQNAITDKVEQNIAKIISSCVQNVNEFVANMQTRIKLFSQELTMVLRTNRVAIEKATESNERTIQNMLTIFTQLKELLKKSKQNSDALPLLVKPSLSAIESKIQTSVAKIAGAVHSHLSEMEKMKPSIRPGIDSDYYNQLKALRENFVRRNEEKTQFINDIITNSTKASAETDVRMEVLRQALDKKCSITNRTSSDIVDRTSSSLRDHISEMASHETNVEDVKKALNDSKDNFCQKTQQLIAESHETMKKFSQVTYTGYNPTGMTPSKREYSINTQLAATTPHEVIKQRLQQRLEQSLHNSLNNISLIDE